MPSKPLPSKPIRAVLGESDLVAPLLAQHKRLSRLQQSFAKTLPRGWDSLCRVAALEGTSVVIAAANGAIATNLKATSPKLLENFRELLKELPGEKTIQEQELTSIRIVVQPEISTWRPPTPTAVRLAAQKSAMSDAQLNDLSADLPDSPLKKAVDRLRRSRAQSGERALTRKR